VSGNCGGWGLAQVIGIGLERQAEEGHFFAPWFPSLLTRSAAQARYSLLASDEITCLAVADDESRATVHLMNISKHSFIWLLMQKVFDKVKNRLSRAGTFT
jgi:hypothetical protein